MNNVRKARVKYDIVGDFKVSDEEGYSFVKYYYEGLVVGCIVRSNSDNTYIDFVALEDGKDNLPKYLASIDTINRLETYQGFL